MCVNLALSIAQIGEILPNAYNICFTISFLGIVPFSLHDYSSAAVL